MYTTQYSAMLTDERLLHLNTQTMYTNSGHVLYDHNVSGKVQYTLQVGRQTKNGSMKFIPNLV